MERCYIKQNLCLQDAIQEIAKEEGWTFGKMAAFAVAAKEGLFCVTILVKKDEIQINQIDVSESCVVIYNTVYNEDGSIEGYADYVTRDVFESGMLNILNDNKNCEVSLLLDYKKNFIKTLGGEIIVKIFVDENNRLNVFTKNPIKEVKRNKIGDLPKETIYFGERDGLCSCQRKAKDPYENPKWYTEEFFNEILPNEDQIMLVNVNNKLQAVKLLKVFELLPDGWYIHICENNNNNSIRKTIAKYCLSNQKDDLLDDYLNYINGLYKQNKK